MYSVFIVEDELLARLAIHNSVAWEDLGLFVIGSASDGQDAWEKYNQLHPNILITDIKMPTMSGIELITRIRQIDKKIKIIIISCVEEFEAARQAISLGVSSYKIKVSMTINDLENSLKEIVAELENDSSVASGISSNETIQHNALLMEDALETILNGGNISYDVRLLLKDYEINKLGNGQILLFTFEVPHFDEYCQQNVHLFSTALAISIIKNILAKYGKGDVFIHKDNNFILLAQLYLKPADTLRERSERLARNVIGAIQKYFNILMTCGISLPEENIDHISSMYDQAQTAAAQSIFCRQGGVFNYADCKHFKENCTKIWQDWIHKIINEQPQMLGKDICEFLLSNQNTLPKNRMQLQNFFFSLIYVTISSLKLNCSNFMDLLLSYHSRFQICETLNEFSETYHNFLDDLRQSIARQNQFSPEILTVLNYIQNNLNKNISLTSAADIAGLSANYLSNLFKREMNMNFTQYVTHMRIDRAKELLANSPMKIYKIAESVGFTDNTYFTRTFKKQVGCSPYEYRKKLMTSEDEHNERFVE